MFLIHDIICIPLPSQLVRPRPTILAFLRDPREPLQLKPSEEQVQLKGFRAVKGARLLLHDPWFPLQGPSAALGHRFPLQVLCSPYGGLFNCLIVCHSLQVLVVVQVCGRLYECKSWPVPTYQRFPSSLLCRRCSTVLSSDIP